MVAAYRQALGGEVARRDVFAGKARPVILGEPEQWMAGVLESLRLSIEGQEKEAQLVRSDAFSRQAKGVVDEAKTRASELPDDLVARVRQTQGSQSSSSGNGGGQRRRSGTRKTSTSRKTKAASR